MKEEINELLNFSFKMLGVYNLILMICDAYFGYYDWLVISGACALLSYFFYKITNK